MDLGWTGVELFYVISGFLITSILLRSRRQPRYFRTFYMRRALRIFPIYWLVLVIAVLFAVATTGAAGSAPFYALYVQNYVPQVATSFSDGLPFLNHTWTLAIEEQFYWVWPIAVLLLSRRRLISAVLSLLVVAPIARLALLNDTSNPYAALATLPAQADALAGGALIAILIDRGTSFAALRRGGYVAVALGSLATSALLMRTGLSSFGTTSLWATDPVNVLLLSSLVCVFAGVLALTIATRALPRLLSLTPLRFTGRISYGLYLYYPLAVVATRALTTWSGVDDSTGTVRVLAGMAHLVVLYLIACVSWRYIERPLLGLKARLTHAPSDAGLGGATLPLRMGNVATMEPAP